MLSRRAILGLSAATALLAACDGKPRQAPVRSSGGSDVGGPFSLIDQDGKPVTEAILRGKWSVIYFGFTYCPDVCPTSLQVLSAALEKLGRKGEAVQPILISVDPERDTPAQMKSYIASPAFRKTSSA